MSVATKSTRNGRSATKPKSSGKKKFKSLLALFFIFGSIGFIGASFEAMRRLQEASSLVPKLPAVMAELSSTPSEIVSADGQVLFRLQTEYRKGIHRSEIPQKVVNATLAAEDKRFYDHNGVDLYALGRITVGALGSGRSKGGGSTLTMQIAKMVFTSPERSLDRKLKDMALAIQIERMLTKDQIVELYLNQSYFGEGAHGIVAAADVYFGKTLDELSISECAMLARCVRRPSDINPVKNLKESTNNRDDVLAIMRDEKMISTSEYNEAIKEPVKLRESSPAVITAKKTAPYFVDFVLKELRSKEIDISRGGYRVYTTINMKAQKIAEERVKQSIKNMSRRGVTRVGFLATDNRGRIVVMVPDTDYSKRQFNMMDSAPGRQPGSSFKPFVYATGIELGAFGSRGTISTAPFMIQDDRGRRRPIKGGSGKGNIAISSALASSNNTAAVRAQELTGTENVVRASKDIFGLTRSNIQPVTTLALGACEVLMTEMAGAYSVFQNHGDRMTAYAIERITRPDGTVVYLQPNIKKRVLSPETADAIDLMLRGVVTRGTGKAASVVTNARGKTGTTSSNKDAWFCGYTDKLIGICWMARILEDSKGRVSSEAMYGVMGGTGAAPVWADIMKRIQGEIGEKSRSFGSIPGVNKETPDEVEEETPEDEVTVPTENPQPETPVDPSVVKDPLSNPNGNNPPKTGEGNDPASGTSAGATGGTTGGTVKPPKTTTGGGGSASGDVIYITVCADSGQRSTVYCPEAVKRPYTKGTEPKGRCPIHGP